MWKLKGYRFFYNVENLRAPRFTRSYAFFNRAPSMKINTLMTFFASPEHLSDEIHYSSVHAMILKCLKSPTYWLPVEKFVRGISRENSWDQYFYSFWVNPRTLLLTGRAILKSFRHHDVIMRCFASYVKLCVEQSFQIQQKPLYKYVLTLFPT